MTATPVTLSKAIDQALPPFLALTGKNFDDIAKPGFWQDQFFAFIAASLAA
jgi:hypothetical protein